MEHRDRTVTTMWARGDSVREIAAVVERHPSWVSVRAAKLGLAPRSPRVTPAERAKWCAEYRRGFTVDAIATAAGRHRDTVRKALEEEGVTTVNRARKWPVHAAAFSEPLNAEAWYWIGFLAADGYVRRSAVSLGLEPKCAAALRRFLAFVGSPDRPLYVTAKGRQLSATVHSAAIVADLARHGVVPRKTYSLCISREAAAEPAFWLGLLDGDGSVVISRDGVPTIHLVGTRSVMEDAATFFAAVGMVKRPSVHRAARGGVLWTVRASGHSARELARCLLAAHHESLEPKRRRLETAAVYESRVTRAKLAPRRKRCGYCGSWIERLPSQMQSPHVFCSTDHFHEWRRARLSSRASSPT
jgi:hypothetical protein